MCEYRIPFEIGGEMPNAETRKAIEDARNGKNIVGLFKTVSELMESLNVDD